MRLRRAVVATIVALLATACSHAPDAASVARALPRRLGTPPVVDAHDASIVQDGGTYWLFGTSYACGFTLGKVGTPWCGVNAFSSTDLVDWTPRGAAVPPSDLWQQRCAPPRFGCFRPHVARSPATGSWVLWLNTYDTPAGYRVLVAPSPAGPWTETGEPALAFGGHELPSRGDEDVFVDAEGRGWVAYTLLSKGRPADIAVERLNGDLTSGTGEVVRLPLGEVEAPSLFEHDGRFFLAYSDPACPYCAAATGLATAPSPMGPWAVQPVISPWSCDGQVAEVTRLGLADGPLWLYMADRWSKGTLSQASARLWWEPLAFLADGLPRPLTCRPPARQA